MFLKFDGVSPSGKAAVFGTATRRFESFHPNNSKAATTMPSTCEISPVLFSGSSHSELAKDVADHLKMHFGKIAIERFPDGETSLQILENVRGRDVFAFQSVAIDPNNY